jgi:nucleoside-diphosphate-sugar epimerase
MTEKVLVTGGFGLVGSQTVRRLAADGHHVVATDLGTAAQRKAVGSLPAGVEARWADRSSRRVSRCCCSGPGSS